MSTYSQRDIDTAEVASVHPRIKHTAWFDNEPPPELAAKLSVGDTIVIEQRGSQITGWRFQGVWYDRKSDEDLERERQEMLDDIERRNREMLDANREDWQRRTDALPDWIKCRIDSFMETGGEHFQLKGWGYELCIAELAVLFEAPDFAETAEVNAYCADHGLTGNQFGMARALARGHHEGQYLGGTVSALSPITGDADYSGGTN